MWRGPIEHEKSASLRPALPAGEGWRGFILARLCLSVASSALSLCRLNVYRASSRGIQKIAFAWIKWATLCSNDKCAPHRVLTTTLHAACS